MTRVHVWGASGYAAAEAIRYLVAHPYVRIGALESRSHAGEFVADHFPLLRTTDLRFTESGSVAVAARAGDVVITAGAHGEAKVAVPVFLAAGLRVIDLSADYRFDPDAAYGLTEFNREPVAQARLVANPGCYPTAASLALLPLASLASPKAIAIDAKSGISGAGRNPSVGALFAEVAGDVRAYGLSGHRHQPEIERNLRERGIISSVAFTPHVVPLARGMLIDAYAFYDRPLERASVYEVYHRSYAGSAFVRLLEDARAPSVAAVCGTNDAEIHIDVVGSMVRAICAIDNLGKGSAGQAIQNLNAMLGYPEEAGFGTRAYVA